MIIVSENPIIQEFFEDLGLRLNPRMDIALKNFVYGLLMNERASIKNIAENTIQGQNERQMNRLPRDIIKGDIAIFPRNIHNPYNLGHAFTKIGYPISVGIPIVASPVPSYIGTTAIICKDQNCWYESIKKLIENFQLRNHLGNDGIKYCRKNFSHYLIMKKYHDLINRVYEN